MRIDGDYSFPATTHHVYAILLDPAALTRALPECERLIQLGPGGEGTAFEARLRSGDRVTTVMARLEAARPPQHLGIDLRLHTPAGRLQGRVQIDLRAQRDHTLGAYLVELHDQMNRPVATPSAHAFMQEAARRIIHALCEGLARELHRGAQLASEAPLHGDGYGEMPRAVSVTTPHGRIVALAPTTSGLALTTRATAWGKRALWMGAGVLIGVSAVALIVGLVRRLTEPD